MNWFESFRKASKTLMPCGVQESFEITNNFTPRAQQMLALARKEAERFNHDFIGTEHLLLGLIRLGQGVGFQVLCKMGLNLENVQLEIEKQVGTGPNRTPMESLPYTPRVRKALALAAKEARALSHTYVGTEHILLGLLREGDGVAGRVLLNLGVDVEATRNHILRELDPNFAGTSDETAETQKVAHLKPASALVDTNTRYDVFCAQGTREVIYQNVLFKGSKKLFQENEHDIPGDFLEIEQADGKTMFIARASVVKFCEHRGTPGSEKK
jgi:ATP-dependent Clp protease ATP-binding subunit ClpA